MFTKEYVRQYHRDCFRRLDDAILSDPNQQWIVFSGVMNPDWSSNGDIRILDYLQGTYEDVLDLAMKYPNFLAYSPGELRPVSFKKVV